MRKCLLSYNSISTGNYNLESLKKLSTGLKELNTFPYSIREQQLESAKRASKMSIQGVQEKLSVKLAVSQGLFKIVDTGGTYIIKPQNDRFEQLPENEDLTMHLAAIAGINVPPHGLIRSSDDQLSYFIKRFDRYGRAKKRALEDFAQLQFKTRDTKYDSSVEQVIKTIEKYATFPRVELLDFYRRFLFNFLIGNEDMHVKNYSLLETDGVYKLAPAYDFLNTTIALHNPKEESALPLKGKKRNFTKKILLSYLPETLLQIPNNQAEEIVAKLITSTDLFVPMINKSFLSDANKTRYIELLEQRLLILK